MAAKVPNPRKQFQFNIILPGLNPFLVQEFKTADTEFDQVEHGDTGFDVKTAGKKKISNATMSQIQSAVGLDVYFKAWADSILNTKTGGGLPPSLYKRTMIVEELGNDGVSIIETHIYTGVWPQKINGKDLSRRGSDNTVRSVEFSIDEEE